MNASDDFSLYRSAAVLLDRPGHSLVSLNQLSRRLRINSDDKLRRLLARLEARFGTPLIETANHRLQLTPTGQRLLRLVDELETLATAQYDMRQTLTVEVHPVVYPLVAACLPTCWEVWGDSVRLTLMPLSLGQSRNNSGSTTDLGIGLLDEEIPDREMPDLEVAFSWALLLPRKDRAVLDDALLVRNHECLFLPGESQDDQNLQAWLQNHAGQTRVTCDWAAIPSFVAECGVGLTLTHPLASCEPLVAHVLPDIPPWHLGVFRPRSGKVSEPVQTLLDVLRAHLRKQPALPTPATALVPNETTLATTTVA